MIKGAISEASDDQRATIMACHGELKDVMTRYERPYATAALALLMSETVKEIEDQGEA
jgi:hypothetical protein